MRRAWIAMRHARTRKARTVITPCAVQIARRRAPRWTAARQARKPRSGRVAAAAAAPARQAAGVVLARAVAAVGAALAGRVAAAALAGRVAAAALAGRVAAAAVAVPVAAVVAAVADVVVETERMNMINIKHILNFTAAAGMLALTPMASAQTAYATPDAAANALVDGIARHDGDAVKAVIG